jgi:thymidylate synthase (FAD)
MEWNRPMISNKIEYVDHMGTDLSVVNAARVSHDKESEWEIDREAMSKFVGNVPPESEFHKLSDKDVKLIKYLATHSHWTPFAHTSITLRITAPVPIRTQFFKHKQGFVENEISRRYVKNTPTFFMPNWKKKPEGNIKQGSGDDFDLDDSIILSKEYKEACQLGLAAYNTMIIKGVCPEQARFVLPQGMMTTWYWTGSLAAYARFYKLRTDSHAQSEIRTYAKSIGEIIRPLFPVSWKAIAL